MSIKSKESYRGKSKFSLLTLFATLAITLPVGVYFIAQQNTNLTDQRSRASWNNSYNGCSINSCPRGTSCHCQDGPACTRTGCTEDSGLKASCLNQGRAWCISGKNRNGYSCCTKGYSCNPNGKGGCVK